MTNPISAINSRSVSSASSSSASNLTDSTKKKLEALGIDTANITTEAQGQAALAQSHPISKAAHAKSSKPSSSGNPQETIQSDINALASKLGVVAGTNDTMDDILGKVAAKISELQASAGTNETKKSEASSYQTQYSVLSSEYEQVEASQSMLGKSLGGLANYNKASLGLT